MMWDISQWSVWCTPMSRRRQRRASRCIRANMIRWNGPDKQRVRQAP